MRLDDPEKGEGLAASVEAYLNEPARRARVEQALAKYDPLIRKKAVERLKELLSRHWFDGPEPEPLVVGSLVSVEGGIGVIVAADADTFEVAPTDYVEHTIPERIRVPRGKVVRTRSYREGYGWRSRIPKNWSKIEERALCERPYGFWYRTDGGS